jgi:ParB family transcriptional regulator, chromosome partitioning protein
VSAPKRGLGRGLDALLGAPKPVAASGLTQVRIDAIRPNPQQPRKHFAAASLAELEQSIRELGVLVPIIVRPLGAEPAAGFELIAGERRWRAAAAALLETIPAIVRDADDRSSLELAVVENLQREDLDPIEEAMGFEHLIEKYGFTQERLAERVGKSRPAVANALRLLGLSDALKLKLREGAISFGHAKALLALDPAVREAIAERIVRDGLTVRDVERLGERRKASPATSRARAKSPDLEAVETRLRYALGSPVTLVPGPKGGKIEVRYANDDDLNRILDIVAPEVS